MYYKKYLKYKKKYMNLQKGGMMSFLDSTTSYLGSIFSSRNPNISKVENIPADIKAHLYDMQDLQVVAKDIFETTNGRGNYSYKGIDYYGQFNQGHKHGNGVLKIPIQDDIYIYKGKFENDIFTKGEIFTINGTIFKKINYSEFKKDNGLTGKKDDDPIKALVNGYIIYSDGTEKFGNFLDGELNGQGTIRYSNKSELSGQFVNGKFYGVGEIIYSDRTEKGKFKDGKLDGDECTITYNNNTKITGKFKDGKLDNGEIIYPDRTEKGRFKDEQLIGEIIYPDRTENGKFKDSKLLSGKIIYPDRTEKGIFEDNELISGRKIYQYMIEIGTFKDGKLDEKGSIICHSKMHNNKIIGTFVNGLLNGEGEIIYRNEEKSIKGNFYKGIFIGEQIIPADTLEIDGKYKNGQINGDNIIYVAEYIIYIGNFSNNIFINGKIIYPHKIEEGIFNNNRLDGTITYSYFKISGTFINNILNGIGKVSIKNGETYEGNFYNNLFTGDDIINNDIVGLEGIYKNGKKHGKNILYILDDTIYKGTFKNDIFTDGRIIICNFNKNLNNEFIDLIATGTFINNQLNGNCIEQVITDTEESYSFFGTYINGIRNGLFIEKFRNITINKLYVNDVPNGPFNYFLGQAFEFKCNYTNGKINGICKYTYPNNTTHEINIINDHIIPTIPIPIDDTLDVYKIMLCIISHGCDVKDDKMEPFLGSMNSEYIKSIKYIASVDNKHINQNFQNTELFNIIGLFNNNKPLEKQVEEYQILNKARPEIRISNPNYHHLYDFDEKRTPYDGIFILKNNLGLPNNINIFDWTNKEEKYVNHNIEEFSQYFSRKLYGKDNLKFSLSKFIEALYNWFVSIYYSDNKQLEIEIIDASCRIFC